MNRNNYEHPKTAPKRQLSWSDWRKAAKQGNTAVAQTIYQALKHRERRDEQVQARQRMSLGEMLRAKGQVL